MAEPDGRPARPVVSFLIGFALLPCAVALGALVGMAFGLFSGSPVQEAATTGALLGAILGGLIGLYGAWELAAAFLLGPDFWIDKFARAGGVACAWLLAFGLWRGFG